MDYILFPFLVTSCVVVYGGDVISDVKGRIIDLTHPFDNTTLYYNGMPEFNLTTLLKQQSETFWVEMNKFNTVEHGGTHMDAPSHFVKGGGHVGSIRLTQLIGPAVVIRAEAKAQADRNYEVTVADLQEWESVHGRIPPKAIVMLDFGWTKKWPNMEDLFGTTTPQDANTRQFPGLHPDAAQWLVTERPEVNAVATDVASIDHGPSRNYGAHTTLLAHNIPVLENVAHTDQVPNFATIFAIPMLIQDGTGAPLRIFAVIAEVEESVFTVNVYVITVLYVISLLFVLNYRWQQ